MRFSSKLISACFLCFASLIGTSSCTNEREDYETMKQNASRFSSTFGHSKDNDLLKYTMIAPYTDEYSIDFNKSSVESYTIKDINGNILYKSSEPFTATLNKDDLVIVEIQAKGANSDIKTFVKALNHLSVMPYDTTFAFDASKADLYGDSSKSPLEPAIINYVKRAGGTYINSNNPEILEDADLNKALCRNELEGDVFFTFEHNNGISKHFYYGYQVKNNNDHDIYVTVQNIGFQLDGPGCWLGEDEWIQFYNTKFEFDTTNWNENQWETFNSLYGFSGKYTPKNNQPITYILPAGQHMYVMGGTTSDSYRNIDVFNTADKRIKGGCSNAAVLFSIHGGKADGAFYVYDDPEALIGNTTHQGYITHKDGHYDANGKLKNYGSQYIGYDTCHGVVDMEATWYFNDKTVSQDLPVSYYSYYDDTVKVNENNPGIPYSKLNPTEHLYHGVTSWVTHINPQSSHVGVGTDMTQYITINEDGNWVTISREHLDGRGQYANIGNWMIDYQDNFNFINQGDNDRQITLSLNDNGSSAIMIKDKDGRVLDATYSMSRIEKVDNDGNKISNSYEYVLTVKAHSVVQVTLGYNLLANSSGYVLHKVTLK